ncbi:MAG TPA: hypothetical protein VIY73_28520, partial [Polyangiaceae bacterium]
MRSVARRGRRLHVQQLVGQQRRRALGLLGLLRRGVVRGRVVRLRFVIGVRLVLGRGGFLVGVCVLLGFGVELRLLVGVGFELRLGRRDRRVQRRQC